MKKLFALICFCTAFLILSPYTHAHGQAEGQAPAPAPGPGMGGWGGRDFFGEAMADMDRAFAELDSEPTLRDTYYLGRAVAAHILTLYEPYTQNPELTLYVNKIAQTLVINSSAAAFRGFFVMILDTPEFNAFASPGGHIFLTRGLIEQAESEDMLAAVIAHELAHIILGHGLSMVREMLIFDEMAALAGRAADFTGNTPEAQRLMGFRNSVAAIVETMVRYGYSQVQEFEADIKALELLAAAGYDPGALAEMLRILERTQPSQTGGFNSTHPTPAERIRNIEGPARQIGIPDTRSHRVQRFRDIR